MSGFNTWRCSCGATGPGGAPELAEHWQASGHDPYLLPTALPDCGYCSLTSTKFGELREQVRLLASALNRIQHSVAKFEREQPRMARIRDIAREALVEAHQEVWT